MKTAGKKTGEKKIDDVGLAILNLAPEIRHCLGAAIRAAQDSGLGWPEFMTAVEIQWSEHALTLTVLEGAVASLSKPARGMP